MTYGHLEPIRCAEMNHFWRKLVNKLRHSEISTSRQAVFKSMLEDLERTIQILQVDICTEEERVRVFDKADPLYSALARALTVRQPDRPGRRP